VDTQQKDVVAAQLNEVLSGYKEQFTAVQLKLKETLDTIPPQLVEIQKKIDVLYSKIKELDKTSSNVEGMVGLKGSTLIDFLVAVRTFAKSVKNAAEVYAPLVSILTGIKSMVESDIELLGGDKTSVFIAGNRLLNIVGFLSSYTITTRTLIANREQNLAMTFSELKLLEH